MFNWPMVWRGLIVAGLFALSLSERAAVAQPAAEPNAADPQTPEAAAPEAAAPAAAPIAGRAGRAPRGTALVEVRGFAVGTAFCIQKRGLFVTTAQSVAAIVPGASLRLVLDSGSKQPRAIAARLVASDEIADVAVLLAQPVGNFSSLPLGDDLAVNDEMQVPPTVDVLGYPLSKRLGAAAPQPQLGLQRVQILGALDFDVNKAPAWHAAPSLDAGFCGGPAIDAAGKVVGIAAIQPQAAGAGIVIPVSRLRALIAQPALLLRCPPQPYFSARRPPTIEIELVQFADRPEPMTVEARFPGSLEGDRVFTARKSQDLYRIDPPAFVPADTPRVRLTALAANERRVLDVDDAQLELGRRAFRLVELRRIEPHQDATLATTVAGERFAGQLRKFDELLVAADGTRVDPLTFAVIDIAVQGIDPERFRYRIAARSGNVEAASLEGRLDLVGVPDQVDPAVRADTLAYWRFEEGKAWQDVAVEPMVQLVRDSSGNGNHLRTQNGGAAPRFSDQVPVLRVPASGQANRLSLDNTQPPEESSTRDLFSWCLGPGPSLQQTRLDRWTIEASVRFDRLGDAGAQTVLGIDGSNQPADPKRGNFELRAVGDKLIALAHTADGQPVTVEADRTLAADHWYQVVLVCDAQRLRLYLRSGDDAEFRVAGEAKFSGPMFLSGSLWTIGRGYDDGKPSAQLFGEIDEVRISQAAIEPAEFLMVGKPTSKQPGAGP